MRREDIRHNCLYYYKRKQSVHAIYCLLYCYFRNYNRMSSNWNNYHNENRYAPPESEDRNPGPPPVSHNSSNETGNKVPQRRPESPAGSVSSRHLKRHKSRYVDKQAKNLLLIKGHIYSDPYLLTLARCKLQIRKRVRKF